MFLGAGARSKTSVRQKLVLKLAAALVNTTPTDGSVSASKLAATSLGSGVSMINGTIQQSVAASALTVALKTLAGTDPTASDPIYVVFRNATASLGDFSVLTITSAISLVISSGSTMGTSNALAFRLWLVAFNDAGTTRLGLINCLTGQNIYPLGQLPIASSTAEGGAGAADSSGVFYTGTAVASKAYAVLGYLTWESGLATAGTWSSAATRIELLRPYTPLPGAVVQTTQSGSAAVATGTTVVPNDNTTPQNTEGDQYMTVSITPSSAANALYVTAQAQFAHTIGNARMIMALFQDATASALVTAATIMPTSNSQTLMNLEGTFLALGTASTTFKIRTGSDTAGTTTFNGENGAARFNGSLGSFMRVREVMI